MHGYKVNIEGHRTDSDFRSLGTSGVFEALSGSRYGSSVDLTGGTTTAAKARPLSKALQPKVTKDQQRTPSYRQPVIALQPRAFPMRGPSGAAEQMEKHRYGHTERSSGNYSDQHPSNQGVNNQMHSNQNIGIQILASKPRHFLRSNNDDIFQGRGPTESVTLGDLERDLETPTVTPGTAQAHAQTLWIEKSLSGARQPVVRVEKENRTWQNDAGYRSVPLSNQRIRRNSTSDGNRKSMNPVQNLYNSSLATSTQVKPRTSRYGSMCDLSRETETETKSGNDVTKGSDSYGLLLTTSGLRKSVIDTGSRDPDADGSSISDSRYRQRDCSATDIDHVTGSTRNRGLNEVSRSTSGVPPVIRSQSTHMAENWNNTRKAPEGSSSNARENDYLTYIKNYPMVRNRRSSVDQAWSRKETDQNNYTTQTGSSMPPPRPAPWTQPSGGSTSVPSFRERTQSTTLNRFRGSCGDLTKGRNQDNNSTVEALRSSRNPSARITDTEFDNPRESEPTSRWNSGEPEVRSQTHPSVEVRTNSGSRDDVIVNPGQYSSSERAIGDVRVRRIPPSSTGHVIPDAEKYRQNTTQNGVTLASSYDVKDKENALQNSVTLTSSYDVKDEYGFRRTNDRNVTRQGVRDFETPRDSGDSVFLEKSPSPGPKPFSSWQTGRRNSLPTSVLSMDGRDATTNTTTTTTRGKGGNYESVFAKGDWINAARMTWKSPSRASSRESLVVEDPSFFSGRRSDRWSDWKGSSGTRELTSSAKQPTVAVTMNLEPVEGSPAGKKVQEDQCKYSEFVENFEVKSGSNSRNFSEDSLPVYSRSFQDVSKVNTFPQPENKHQEISSNIPETQHGREPALTDSYKFQEDRDSVKDSQGLGVYNSRIIIDLKISEKNIGSSGGSIEQTPPSTSYPDWKTKDGVLPESGSNRMEILVSQTINRPSEFENIETNPNSRIISENSLPSYSRSFQDVSKVKPFQHPENKHPQISRNIPETDSSNQVFLDPGSPTDLNESPGVSGSAIRIELPTSRESTGSRHHINWKDWYYSGLERSTDLDKSADERSLSTAQISDHESGYQSSGPTLDDLPSKKSNSAERKASQKGRTPSGNSSSNAGVEDRLVSDKDLSFPSDTLDETLTSRKSRQSFNSHRRRGDEGEGGAVVVESTAVRTGKAKEVEIHVRGGSLGVGFSIEGGQGSSTGDRPITVKRIFTASDHLKDKLTPGTAILRVNDKDFSQMTQYNAWNYLKALPEGPALLLVVEN